MASDSVVFELTAKERQLIKKYGYPFPALAKLPDSVDKSRRIEEIEISDFELNQLVGDISRSINDQLGGPRVRSQLLDLCERLEYGQRYGEGNSEDREQTLEQLVFKAIAHLNHHLGFVTANREMLEGNAESNKG